MRNLYTSAVVTSVKAAYRNFSLDLAEDLMGTQKLIRLMYPIMGIFQKGKTFMCDEIYFTNFNYYRIMLKPLSSLCAVRTRTCKRGILRASAAR